PPFFLEAQAGEAATHGLVAGRRARRQSAQAEGGEGICAGGRDRIGGVALAPGAAVADQHADVAYTGAPIDVTDALRADELAARLVMDGEEAIAAAAPQRLDVGAHRVDRHRHQVFEAIDRNHHLRIPQPAEIEGILEVRLAKLAQQDLSAGELEHSIPPLGQPGHVSRLKPIWIGSPRSSEAALPSFSARPIRANAGAESAMKRSMISSLYA